MANPQPDQYTRISNELLDAITGAPMNGSQYAIVLLVIRNTYGWNKKSAPFSWAKMAASIGIDPRNVRRLSLGLQKAGVLTIEGDQIGVQKDYHQWGPLTPLGIGLPGRSRPAGGVRAPHSTGQERPFNGVRAPHSYDEPKDSKDRKTVKETEPNPTSPGNDRLPNGKPDTAYNRVDLGLVAFDPAGAPDFSRLGFVIQERMANEWDAILSQRILERNTAEFMQRIADEAAAKKRKP